MHTPDAAIAILVDGTAIQRILEAGTDARWVDTHPWYVARDLLAAAQARDRGLSLLLADAGTRTFRYWSDIRSIEVVEYTRGSCETRVTLGRLVPISPIWEAIDSVFLLPSQEQLHREAIEPIGTHRTALRTADLHPYAICEAPPLAVPREPEVEPGTS